MRYLSLRALSAVFVAMSLCLGGVAADIPGSGADVGKTVVYRDTWGVPHLYAPTVEAGMFAMAWAQAEDRPQELLKNLLRGMGEIASVEGSDAVRSDVVVRMFDHYGGAKERFGELSPEVRSHLDAFVRGLNAYYASHPEDVPSWWGERHIDPYMVIAFSRLFLYSWSIDQAFDDLRRGGIEPGFDETQRGSNEFAVAPSRSAEGAAILAIDPHLAWLGASRFWEFRIHAGNLHGSGFSLPGVPYIGLGHNRDVAWAMTTGGPDTADIYELTLNESDPTKYLFDGEWRTLASTEISIDVKDGDAQHVTVYRSHHGPVVAIRGGRAYASRTSYADTVATNEAWHALNFAADYQGAVAAMDTLTLFPQNVMVADTSGNIYYQRTGRVPRRPEGFDWSKPVNGSTSATEWEGVHPASDHPQILNPPGIHAELQHPAGCDDGQQPADVGKDAAVSLRRQVLRRTTGGLDESARRARGPIARHGRFRNRG